MNVLNGTKQPINTYKQPISPHLVRTAHVVNVLNVAVVEGGGGVVVRVLRP